MKGIKQPSLLDLGEPEFDLDFPGIVRIDLGEGAWVEHLPNWLKGHQDLFETLRETTGWRRQERQMYDQVIEVPQLIAKLPDDGPGDPLVDAMGESLSKRYGVKFDSIMLAYYRDGNDSVAWHGDKLKHKVDAHVATVSTGSPRGFRIRLLSGGPSRGFSLGWGDLLVMGGTCQKTCEHTIPKLSNAEPRISIIFRHHYQLLL